MHLEITQTLIHIEFSPHPYKPIGAIVILEIPQNSLVTGTRKPLQLGFAFLESVMFSFVLSTIKKNNLPQWIARLYSRLSNMNENQNNERRDNTELTHIVNLILIIVL